MIAAARKLQAACLQHDGVPPFSDQSLLELERGERRLLGDETACAIVSDSQQEFELSVHPQARGAGAGTALAEAALLSLRATGQPATGSSAIRAWAHGDLPGSARLAKNLGMSACRTLLQLRAAEPRAGDPAPARNYLPGDLDALVALNTAAFHEHPEQGRMTKADFEARLASPWHSDDNLLVLPAGDELAAFAWLKPDSEKTELYAIGVAPQARGNGLGAGMLAAAIERIRQLGKPAHLYVEGDNAAALRLYERAGFTRFAIDVQYRL